MLLIHIAPLTLPLFNIFLFTSCFSKLFVLINIKKYMMSIHFV